VRRGREPDDNVTDVERKDHWLEIAATVLLALAAIATAWSTYQSAVWRGMQAEAQSASIAARVESTREAAVANRQAQVDLALFTQWIDAYAQHRTELTDFYRRRFREEFVPAFSAWVATKPLQNPSAPLSPFAMPQYKLAASAKAEALEQQAGELSRTVQRNVDRSDSYMLAVVLFAIVLFFAALSTRMPSRDMRMALLALGYVIFVGTAVWLATQPVHLSA
jgi:hypothetical protein